MVSSRAFMTEGASYAETQGLSFLAEVIEQLPHPMFVKDRQFRYVLVNSALAKCEGATG